VIEAHGFQNLLAGAKANADWAWRELVASNGPGLRRFAELHGAESAEDTVADVFASVARDIGQFEGDEAAFRGWLYRIAHNRLIDARRKKQRSVPTVSLNAADAVAGDESTHDALTALLQQLPKEQRAIVFLRACLDLPFNEVAGIVGKRPGAIKMAYRRSLDDLAKHSDLLALDDA
jgi:RNA polymerase sigma-70 factor, ECF subfamily